MPLCFLFNAMNLLSEREQYLLANCEIYFSGNYCTSNGNNIAWYDFDFDYDFFKQDVLQMDSTSGILGYSAGKTPNIMDEIFPAMHDKRIARYQFSNKLTTMYNKWKLKYSDDNHPYITNLSWAYSNNQDNNYKYKEFPTLYTPQTGLAIDTTSDGYEWHYDLFFPVGEDNIAMYDEYNTLSATKYKNILNNYCLNWFEMATVRDVQTDESSFDNLKWVNVIDDHAYYNGVLYDLTNVYAEGNVAYNNKVDKFGVFIYLNTDGIKTPEQMADLKFCKYSLMIKDDDTFVSNPNCDVNEFFPLHAYSSENYLYDDTNEYKDYIECDNIFTYNNEGKGDYIEASAYNGLDYYELNKYYAYTSIYEVIDDFRNQLISYNTSTTISSYLSDAINNIIPSEYRYSSYIAYASSLVFSGSYANCEISYISAYERINIFKTYCLVDDESKHSQISYKIFGSLCYSDGDKYKFNELGYYLSKHLYVNDNSNNIIPMIDIQVNNIDETFMDPSYAVCRHLDTTQLHNIYANSLYDKKDLYNSGSINQLDSNNTISYTIVDDCHFGLNKEQVISTTYVADDILNIYKTAINAYITKNNINEYEFLPVMENQKSIYSKDTFIKRLYCNRMYEDNTLEENMIKDKYVMYVSKYNINKLLQHYDKPTISKDEHNKYFVPFYARVLDKDYLNAWYNEISRDEDYTAMKPEWHKEWYKQIYISYKVLCKTDLGLETKNKYISLKHLYDNVKNAHSGTYDDDLNYIKFANAITYNNVYQVFSFNTDDDLGKAFEDSNKDDLYYLEFNLFIKDEYVRMTQDIWDVMNIDNKSDHPYKDFYIFRLFEPYEYDRKYYSVLDKFIGVDIKTGEDIYIKHTLHRNIKFLNNDKYHEELDKEYYDFTEVDNSLTPLFNDCMAEQKTRTQIYEHFVLDDIVPVHFGSITNYRYNKSNAIMMFKTNETTKEVIRKILSQEGLNRELYTYDNFSSVKKYYLYTGNINTLLGYNPASKLNVFQKDGVTYGYYMVNIDVNNTSDMFNIRGISGDRITDTVIDDIENAEIKYIQYINGVNIVENRDKLKDLFKRCAHFMYVSPLSCIAELNTLNKPNIFNLNLTYSEKLKNNNNGSNELDIFVSPKNTSQQKQTLLRYTNSIVPYIIKRGVIPNLYMLKHKDIKKVLIDTGEYNSIGDSVLYKKNEYVNTFSGYNIYSMNSDENSTVKNYNYVSEIYYPLEYKHYNSSKMINLKPEIVVKVKGKHTYEKILELEKYDAVLNVFKAQINGDNRFTDDQLLFLFKKYTVEYDTTPVGVNMSNTAKLYTLTYKFKLL